jgi:type I restriction enzyme, S subunit
VNRHPSYQETGCDWIGEIPSHWNLVRGRFLFTAKKEINLDLQCKNLLSLTLTGVLNKDYESNDGLRPKDYNTYQIFQKDDLVFKMIDLENLKTSRVGITHEEGIMSPVYLRHEPIKSKIDPRFAYLFYYDLYKKAVYNSIGSGVRSSLSSSDLLEMELPVPPIEEQQLISRYLEKKTEQIDCLIERVQKKVELLKEQRTSLINQCVVKGLDPNAEMKDSDVEWIGNIPQHWEVKKLKYLSIVKRGSSPRPIDNPQYFHEEGEFSWVRISDVTSSTKYLNNTKEKLSNLGSSLSTKIYPGDIFLSIAGSVGKPVIANIKCCIHDGFVWFQNLRVEKEFLYYMFLSKVCFQGLGKLGTQLNLNTDTVGNIYIPLPSTSEQSMIIEELESKLKTSDHLLHLEECRILKLHEYRQSLISSVVTGEVRVTENMI